MTSSKSRRATLIFMMPRRNSIKLCANGQRQIVCLGYFHRIKVRISVSYGKSSRQPIHQRPDSHWHWIGSCRNCITTTRREDRGSSTVLLRIECSSGTPAWPKDRVSFGNVPERLLMTQSQKVFSQPRKKSDNASWPHVMLCW